MIIEHHLFPLAKGMKTLRNLLVFATTLIAVSLRRSVDVPHLRQLNKDLTNSILKNLLLCSYPC